MTKREIISTLLPECSFTLNGLTYLGILSNDEILVNLGANGGNIINNLRKHTKASDWDITDTILNVSKHKNGLVIAYIYD